MPANPSPPAVCQRPMHDWYLLCGRPLHAAPEGVDRTPACLMHSRDPQKNWDEFRQEIKTILARTSEIHDFSGFVFTGEADFRIVTFTANAHFDGATFAGVAHFTGATFTKNAGFLVATFTAEADFVDAKFNSHADFRHATFAGSAFFSRATFTGAADFFRATFTQSLSFVEVQFDGIADFTETRFEKPTAVLFYRVNEQDNGLKARLRTCLLEGVRFEDVHWHRQGGRLLLQDELDLDMNRTGVTHELVAHAYRRLVNNFEKSRQYQLAEECIVGEMEMRRRGETFSVLNAYRWLSNYGSSYLLPLLWLGVLAFVIFPVLFGSFGLHRTDQRATTAAATAATEAFPPVPPPMISWRNAWTFANRGHELWQTWKTMALATLETATLQRNPYAVPATGAGRVVQIVMVLTMPGLLALFLFALRRRFRR